MNHEKYLPMPAAPLPSPTVQATWHMQPARVPALHGLRWIVEAWRIIVQKPLLWLPIGLALGVVQTFFSVILHDSSPWAVLLYMLHMYMALVVAIVIQRRIGAPIEPIFGPPMPQRLAWHKWGVQILIFLPVHILIHGALAWQLRCELAGNISLLIALPLAAVLAWQLLLLLGIGSGAYAHTNPLLVFRRAAVHIIASLVGVFIVVAAPYCIRALYLFSDWLLDSAPPLSAAAFLSTAAPVLSLALATWALLAQALGAMLNLPLAAAPARAARTMWRNAPAFALYLALLACAAAGAFMVLEHLPGSVLLPENAGISKITTLVRLAAAGAWCNVWPYLAGSIIIFPIFALTLTISPWLMVRDIFRDAAVPADEKGMENEREAAALSITTHPARVPFFRGLRWLCVDVWRQAFKKPLLWHWQQCGQCAFM